MVTCTGVELRVELLPGSQHHFQLMLLRPFHVHFQFIDMNENIGRRPKWLWLCKP